MWDYLQSINYYTLFKAIIIVSQLKNILPIETTGYSNLSKVNDKVYSLLDIVNLTFWKKNWHLLVLALKKSSLLLEIKKPRI